MRRALKLVSPDLAQMEAVVVEAAEQTMPVVFRSDSLGEDMRFRLRRLDAAADELKDRLELATLQFNAAAEGFRMQLTDIERARGMILHGISHSED